MSVQSALVMYPIYAFGSDEQKNTWLPALASGEKLGCFGLTEPDFGSNPGGMRTRARKVGNEYVLNGEKMWITSGSIADVAVIWAKTDDSEDPNDASSIRGFLVETDRPGFRAEDIHGKWSLRASVTSGLSLAGCPRARVEYAARIGGPKSPLMCLNQARYGIAGERSARPWPATTAHCNIRNSAKQFHNEPIASRSIGPRKAGMDDQRDHQGAVVSAAGRPPQRSGRSSTSTFQWPSEIMSGWR